ncbi:hypothetical protein JTB14_029112 [Gonioctena quinquepunctata]|nr:hypothetical protein JTB14_029112 [Gonioctena quinquepunctata]
MTISDKGVKVISSETDINQETLGKLGLTARIVDKSSSRVAVMGVPDDFRPGRVEARINDLRIPIGHEDEVKALHKYGSKEGTCIWVLEATPTTRMRLIEKGSTSLGWVRCRVRDHVRIIRCYNCQKYGHLSAVCKAKKPVLNAQGHMTRESAQESRD